MPILFTNNALTTLAAGISDSATVLTVASATGSRLPAVTGGAGTDYFVVTLEDSAGNREFVKVEHRSTDTLGDGSYPCTRGYWGSTPRAWSTGDSVDVRWAADAMQEFLEGLSGRYLGAFATEPTETEYAGALQEGDLYYDTVTGLLMFYDGADWDEAISLAAASLAAIAALTPAANKVPYFTDATTAALADLSAYGRTLIATADAAAARTALATASGTETLTNKTITNPAYTTQTLSDAATINWDMSAGGVATVTLGGNRTVAAPTNLKAGVYILHVIQDGTGSRTLTWNSVFKWSFATAPVLSTGAGKRDIISFVCDGTNLYGSYMVDVR